MGAAIDRIRKAKEARKTVRDLASQNNVLVVHYSCETFYDRANGASPRVTSIAVREVQSGQTHSFSIHKIAELRQIPPEAITQSYDTLEREMLSEFFDFVRSHQGFAWVHWNMRDATFGFAALEHRFQVLKGDPISIPDSRRFDLARIVPAIYGKEYAPHHRLDNLAKHNAITQRDFLLGADEAAAFENGEYFKLHLSTLRKADVIAEVFERVADESLKTRTKWYQRYGNWLFAAGDVVKEHPIFALIGLALAILGIVKLS